MIADVTINGAGMTQRRSYRRNNEGMNRYQFLLMFWGIVAILFVVKLIFPQWTTRQIENWTSLRDELPLVQRDSVLQQSDRVDSLFLAPRKSPLWLTADGQPVKNRVTSVPTFADAFPDLNDVQLATAEKIGVQSCQNREEATRQGSKLVFIGDSPYYIVKPLSHSIPYLVPRAATLLEEISRSFLDSLTTKGIPFHKLVVTSVLRTEDDVQRLRKHNANASENSCHRFGTTFDISYNHYFRVQDPELQPQVETWAVTLKSILAEVLRDQRERGTCYVKYEVHQSCFHITAR